MHARRIRSKKIKPSVPTCSRDSAARRADRRVGARVAVEYLYDLFAASPQELFSRVSVLSVLDLVKSDRDLLTDKGVL